MLLSFNLNSQSAHTPKIVNIPNFVNWRNPTLLRPDLVAGHRTPPNTQAAPRYQPRKLSHAALKAKNRELGDTLPDNFAISVSPAYTARTSASLTIIIR